MFHNIALEPVSTVGWGWGAARRRPPAGVRGTVTRIARATAPRRRFGVPGVTEPAVPYVLPGPVWSAGSDLGALGQRRRRKKKGGLFGIVKRVMRYTPEGMVLHAVTRKRKKKRRAVEPEEAAGAPVEETEPVVTAPAVTLAPAAPLLPMAPAPVAVPMAPYMPMPAAAPAPAMMPAPPTPFGPQVFFEPQPPPSEEAYMFEEVQAPWPGVPVAEEEAAEMFVQPHARRRVREALTFPTEMVEAGEPDVVYAAEEPPSSDLLGNERVWWWQPTEPSGAELSDLGQDDFERRFVKPVQRVARRIEPLVTALARKRPAAVAARDVYAVPDDTTPAWLWPALGLGAAALVIGWLAWPRARGRR